MPQFVGEKVQYLRRQRKMLQADVARQLGISRAHINNIESGRRPPSLEFILRVAQFFEVTLEYLLRDSIEAEAVVRYTGENMTDQNSSLNLLGPKLYTLRTTHNLTQAQLANRIGLRTHAHISLLESGRKDPSIEVVLRMADVFGLTTDDLLRDTIPIEAIIMKQSE